MIIYKITNKINNKAYIGQTIGTLQARWKRHCRGTKLTLHKAINKYGKENFSVEILKKCKNLDELNLYEEQMIKKFNTLAPKGYNIMRGGFNKRHHPLTKQKLSNLNKGKKQSLQTIKKRIQKGPNHYRFGRKISEAIKKKISKNAKKTPIVGFNKKLKKSWYFKSLLEAEKFGFCKTAISRCIRRVKHYKTHRGFVWSNYL